jgi:Protein of unknown function (DUF2764)/ATP synthase (C/AC39) subunit
MKYYFLVSYLPEIHRDDKKLKYRLADLVSEKSHIAPNDWEDVELVLLKGDVLQIERLLSGKETEVEFTVHGREFWKDQVKSPKEVPEWLSEFFESVASEGFSPRNLDRLYQAYFDFAVRKASNLSLRAYLTFERDLRNILTAVRARRKGLPPSEHLVGEGDLEDVLGRSSAEDFGLSEDYPWIHRILEAKSPQDIEETVQRIVWETIEEMTETNQFEFDVVLAYLLKLQLLERALGLSEEQGLDIVRRLEEL